MLYLDQNCHITKNQNNLVDIHLADGTVLEAVEPRRLFPVSRPRQYITFLDSDENEVARIREISDVNSSSRQAVTDSMDYYYLVPEILSVQKIEKRNGVIQLYVTTDRGKTDFLVTNTNRGIQKQVDGSLRFRDSNDNRYVITHPDRLDRHSRTALFAYL